MSRESGSLRDSGLEALPPNAVSVNASSAPKLLRPVGGSSLNSDGSAGRTVLRSPASALFETTYQGGPAVEVFSAHGSNPTANWKISGAVQRVYDKSVKGYVFQCEGGPSAKMQLPKDERRLLGLVQPYLVLQLTVPSQKPFALELSISDTSKARRRVLLSTSFREPVRTPLHTRLPLASLHREVWLNLTFDLVDLVAKCFPAATFWRLEGVTIHAACKVRRVFTLKTPPHNGSSGLLAEPFTSAPATPADGHGGDGSDGAGSLRASGIGSLRGGYDDGSCSPPPLPSPLPRGYELPPGTVSITQVYSTSHALGGGAAERQSSGSHHGEVGAGGREGGGRGGGDGGGGFGSSSGGGGGGAGGGGGGGAGGGGGGGVALVADGHACGAGGADGGSSACASPALCGTPPQPPWSPAFGSGLLSQSPAATAAANASVNASSSERGVGGGGLPLPAHGSRQQQHVPGELLPPPLRNMRGCGMTSSGRLPAGTSPSTLSPLHRDSSGALPTPGSQRRANTVQPTSRARCEPLPGRSSAASSATGGGSGAAGRAHTAHGGALAPPSHHPGAGGPAGRVGPGGPPPPGPHSSMGVANGSPRRCRPSPAATLSSLASPCGFGGGEAGGSAANVAEPGGAVNGGGEGGGGVDLSELPSSLSSASQLQRRHAELQARRVKLQQLEESFERQYGDIGRATELLGGVAAGDARRRRRRRGGADQPQQGQAASTGAAQAPRSPPLRHRAPSPLPRRATTRPFHPSAARRRWRGSTRAAACRRRLAWCRSRRCASMWGSRRLARRRLGGMRAVGAWAAAAALACAPAWRRRTLPPPARPRCCTGAPTPLAAHSRCPSTIGPTRCRPPAAVTAPRVVRSPRLRYHRRARRRRCWRRRRRRRRRAVLLLRQRRRRGRERVGAPRGGRRGHSASRDGREGGAGGAPAGGQLPRLRS